MSIVEYSVQDLLGKTFVKVEESGDGVRFVETEGTVWDLCHEQDCCESVTLEDVVGSLEDLVGAPLLMAEEVTNTENPKEFSDHFLWTFYKFATLKGYVTLRFYGNSNGYYSVTVGLMKDGERWKSI